MSRDLTAAWELLNAVTRARQQLASARPMIWERERLPTAERTVIVKASADGDRWRHVNGGDQIVMRVSVETHLRDGRRLTSCLDIVATPKRWYAQPYITLASDTEQILWEGVRVDRDDPSGFAEHVDSAARNLLDATMGMDFSDPHKG
ncbi:MAG: hypothetical protein ABSD62_07985 [Candidatus Limnocylindrales bacterium]|jgi:hypothetical protein